jgi:hypothetical protein
MRYVKFFTWRPKLNIENEKDTTVYKYCYGYKL